MLIGASRPVSEPAPASAGPREPRVRVERWLAPDLPPEALADVERRRAVSRRLFWPVYAAFWAALRILGGYRIENVREIRARYAALASQAGPVLICANHLTFIDSLLIAWALGGGPFYARHDHRLSWNVPAADVFGRKALHRAILRVTKCVPIDRKGSLRHKDRVLQVCAHLLARGETVTIFPEGGRSRSGRFDPARLTAGVGKIVAHVGACRVLCVAMRADGQDRHSDFPARGSRFRLAMEVLDFAGEPPGPGRYRAIAGRIGETIARLEHGLLHGAKRSGDP